MKKVLLVSLVLFSFFTSKSQNLSSATLSTHYSLIETDVDETGNHSEIVLTNAPYQGLKGVYSYGGYLFDVIDTDSSLITTPDISTLNEMAFAVQLEFRLDTLVQKPIIVVGEGWRYLGMGTKHDNTFVALHNGSYYDTPSEKIKKNQWYLLTIVHTVVDSTTNYFIDDELIFSISGMLDHPDDDINISNSHFGNGEAFRGFWRNLKVYSGDFSLSDSSPDVISDLTLFPNPFSSTLFIKGDIPLNTEYSILNLSGQTLIKGTLKGNFVNLGLLQDGLYLIKINISETTSLIRKVVKRTK